METPVLVHETRLHELTGSDVLATRVRLATLSGGEQCGETEHVPVLQPVAQSILYQLVVLTVRHSGPLGVELPDSVRLVGADLTFSTHCLHHVARHVVEAVFVNLGIEPVDGFKLSDKRVVRE